MIKDTITECMKTLKTLTRAEIIAASVGTGISFKSQDDYRKFKDVINEIVSKVEEQINYTESVIKSDIGD